MTNNQRQQFWNTLCSVNGQDTEADRKQLTNAIIRPDFLYRYRPITVSSIDALQTNRLYFSNANYYDDPFDTLIQINFEEIREYSKSVLSRNDVPDQMLSMGAMYGINQNDVLQAVQTVNNTSITQIIDGVVDYLKNNIQSLLKQNLWSVCFSERGNNEVMWLKYADQYKGFCLIYDLKDDSKLLCGKQEKCHNCIASTAYTSIYPIYYSDKGYDATEYAKNLAASEIARTHLSPDKANLLISTFSQGTWEPERIALIKSRCHEYDEEWRMLLSAYTPGPVLREWVPYGVILGLRTSSSDKALIIRSAKIAGIAHIFELYVTNEYMLDLREIS